MFDPNKSDKVRNGRGFIAALDQSGGSTPKALGLYGIGPDAYSSEGEMYDLIHEMRSRIIASPAFNGDRVIGSILFEMTMDREIEGMPTARYLWEKKAIVPFLKIDKGLLEAADGVQLMKPMPGSTHFCRVRLPKASLAPRNALWLGVRTRKALRRSLHSSSTSAAASSGTG